MSQVIMTTPPPRVSDELASNISSTLIPPRLHSVSLLGRGLSNNPKLTSITYYHKVVIV